MTDLDEFGRLLFLMLAGHAFADFYLQHGFHSAAKRPGNGTGIPWQLALAYHSLVHGALVAIITGNWHLGALEAGLHAYFDLGKSRGWIGSKTDQVCHILCKIAWALIAIYV